MALAIEDFVRDFPLWAVRDAKPAKEHYSVPIYAPSDSSVLWENANLCEYLASHGSLILASSSMGASTSDMTDDLDGINGQARDISFLIECLAIGPESHLGEQPLIVQGTEVPNHELR